MPARNSYDVFGCTHARRRHLTICRRRVKQGPGDTHFLRPGCLMYFDRRRVELQHPRSQKKTEESPEPVVRMCKIFLRVFVVKKSLFKIEKSVYKLQLCPFNKKFIRDLHFQNHGSRAF